MTSYESAILLAKALDGKKGEEIKVLKTEGLTTLADYFVICTATSTTQIKAMSDACEEAMEKQGERVHHIEGHRGGTWLLMDFPPWWSISSWMRPGSSMTWSASGATRRRSRWRMC